MKVNKLDTHILKSLSQHVNRENFLLYNDVFLPWKPYDLLQPRHNHPSQWRKFVKDVGKELSLFGLLEFVPLVLHRSESPLPTYLEKYAISTIERERMQKCLSLIQLWLAASNQQFGFFKASKIKRELKVILGNKEPTNFGGYHASSVNFIHWVGLVLVGEKKFPYYVLNALTTAERFGISTNTVDDCFSLGIVKRVAAKYA